MLIKPADTPEPHRLVQSPGEDPVSLVVQAGDGPGVTSQSEQSPQPHLSALSHSLHLVDVETLVGRGRDDLLPAHLHVLDCPPRVRELTQRPAVLQPPHLQLAVSSGRDEEGGVVANLHHPPSAVGSQRELSTVIVPGVFHQAAASEAAHQKMNKN